MNDQYLIAVHRLIDLLLYKTNCIESNDQNERSTFEHFRMMDTQCQTSFDRLKQNHELTSSLIIAQFIEELNGLENKGDYNSIAAMFVRQSEA